MKKSLKYIVLAVVAVLVISIFAACGPKTPTNNEETTAPDEGTTVAVEESTAPIKQLVMGTNAAFAPYEFVDDNGAFAGIDVEIAQTIAAKLGMELVIKDMEFNSLITAVSEGAVDMVLAGLTVTDERKESVDFSDTYATGTQVIIVKEGADADFDFAGKKVGVQAGTTGDIYITDEVGQENVAQYSNGAQAAQALMNGQVDCAVIDNEPAKNLAAANEGLTILETEYTVEDYAAAFSKENTELRDAFNTALAELKADGTIDAIIEKYIPSES